MPQIKKTLSFFIRSLDAGSYLETFFVCAISSLLLVRAILEITDYPQLSSGNFHIAHMLWGGIFLMLALLISLAFLNKEARQVASVLGGIGFGIFIDELGKFITQDNNYLYQPAIAIIYIIFVLIFLTIRTVEKYFPITEKVYAINSLELAKEAVMDDLDELEYAKLINYINQSGLSSPLNNDLQFLIKNLQKKSGLPGGWWVAARKFLKKIYETWVKNKYFVNTIVVITILYFYITLSLALNNLWQGLGFTSIGQFCGSVLAAVYGFFGLRFLIKQQLLKAYESLNTAVNISIFLTQFFLFLSLHMWATIGLFINLMAFLVLKYLISQEVIIV